MILLVLVEAAFYLPHAHHFDKPTFQNVTGFSNYLSTSLKVQRHQAVNLQSEGLLLKDQ